MCLRGVAYAVLRLTSKRKTTQSAISASGSKLQCSAMLASKCVSMVLESIARAYEQVLVDRDVVVNVGACQGMSPRQ